MSVFANLFKRAEATVDNAVGDIGNRIIITIPFLIALGFAAASLSIYLNRTYGAEAGNLLTAAAFCILGCIIWIVVKVRSRGVQQPAAEEPFAADNASATTNAQSIFDNESFAAVLNSAAPVLVPGLVRTGMKNWPLILAAIAGLYVFSRSEEMPEENPGPAE
jgi:ascorbate-specific PTS system EIIC-type component UlaA